jgi:PAS domain S-box-containing protein
MIEMPLIEEKQEAPAGAGASAPGRGAPAPHLRERDRSGRMAPARYARTIALTAAGLASLELISATVIHIPNTGTIGMAVIAWAAWSCGLAAGLTGSAMVLALALYHASMAAGSGGMTVASAAGLVGIALAGPAISLLARARPNRGGGGAAFGAQRPNATWVEEIVHDANVILWEGDAESMEFTFVSDQAERLLGYPVERWLGSIDFWVGLIHEDDRGRVLDACREATAGRLDHEIEYRMTAADGRVIWVRESVRFGNDTDRGSGKLHGAMMDVTHQKHEEVVRMAQRRVLEQVASGDALTEVLDSLARAIEQQIAGSRCLVTTLCPGEESLEIVSAPSILFEDGGAVTGTRVRERQGSCGSAVYRRERVISEDIQSDPQWEGCTEFARSIGARAAWSQPVFGSGNEALGTFCVLKFLPSAPSAEETGVMESAASLAGIAIERERTEREMRQSLSLLKATLDSTTDGILVVDPKGKIVSHNQRFLDLWRIPREVAEARDDDQALAFVLDQLEDAPAFLDRVRLLYAHPKDESFDLIRFKDGRVFERYSRPQMVGEICVGRVWSFRDITERTRAEGQLRDRENQLRHAQKMEAVGRLAGGIAHDFNNLLTAITGYSDLALRALSENDPVCARLREIRKASESATVLTRQLLAFSRKQVLQLQLLDINQVVCETTSLLQRTIGEDIELIIEAGGNLGPVRGDRGQLEQVLVNLAVNARDAMPDGGKLIIETAKTYLDDPYVRSHPGVAAGHYVIISVSDTGVGMDQETRSHIFEPFFTTKAVGRGTGLGLATVYGIVKQSGGNIWVYSEPERGSTFKIYLPMVKEHDATGRDATGPVEIPPGSGTILLVEDDDSVRGLVTVILEDCGYRVVEACNGADGLEAFRSSTIPIDLIVTDVVMPVMSGKEMAGRILASQPETKILFISGYTQIAVKHHGLLESGSNFLQKPFSPKDLATKVRMMLEAPERAAS